MLAGADYVADRALATVLFLSLRMRRPLFLEGEAGVGKTEIAKVLASALGRRLIRLQCYEGLDATTALYEWNYPKQMLRLKLEEGTGHTVEEKEASIFGESFLLQRPLLRAITRPDKAPVLLIDELDRADEEFEAFLLEILSDFAVSIPEIGTVRADRPPRVILTSNRTREVHDALKRRCLYHWIDYPAPDRELAILRARLPRVPETLARDIVAFVQRLRQADLTKSPGVAETLDWAAALLALGAGHLDPAQVERTLGVLLKYQEDLGGMRAGGARGILEETRATARA